MAIALLNPIDAARQARQSRLHDDMQSIDPVTRYKAKETCFNESLVSMGRGFAEEAKTRGEAFQRQLDAYERKERNSPKYLPLTPQSTNE